MSNMFGMLKHLAKTRNFEFSPDFLYHSFSQQESSCYGDFTPTQRDGAVSKDPSLETPCSLSPFCLPMTFDLWIGFLWMTFDFWIGGIQGPIVTISDQSDSNQTMLEPLSHLSFHTMARCPRHCPDADSSKSLVEVKSWNWLIWEV